MDFWSDQLPRDGPHLDQELDKNDIDIALINGREMVGGRREITVSFRPPCDTSNEVSGKTIPNMYIADRIHNSKYWWKLKNVYNKIWHAFYVELLGARPILMSAPGSFAQREINF